MLCRRCEALSRARARRQPGGQSSRVWGAEQIRGVTCTLCDATLDADDIACLLAEKHSQLAQFGLVDRIEPVRVLS